MKHSDNKGRRSSRRSANAPAVAAGPTLREYWAELQRAKAAGEPLPAAPAAPASPAAPMPAATEKAASPPAPNARQANTPAFVPGGAEAPAVCSSGNGSAGSGGGGYGLSLIVPDEDSLERIRKIMRSLCEKDKKRGL